MSLLQELPLRLAPVSTAPRVCKECRETLAGNWIDERGLCAGPGGCGGRHVARPMRYLDALEQLAEHRVRQARRVAERKIARRFAAFAAVIDGFGNEVPF